MSSDAKTFENNRSLIPTWGNLAVVILFVASVAGWLIGYGRFSEKIAQLESKMVTISLRIKDVEQWQHDWPTEGELMMDRAQNTQISELKRRVGQLEAK